MNIDIGMSPDYGRKDLLDQDLLDEMCERCGHEQPCPYNPATCLEDKLNDEEED